MRHLISIDDFTCDQIKSICSCAEDFLNNGFTLQNTGPKKLLINLFFENSTRTRSSFEIAAKRLGFDVVNVDITNSSVQKGETITDTIATINAMKPDFIVLRHNQSGILSLLKDKVDCHLINAGDGTNEHPTQALLDYFVISRAKKVKEGLKIVICGDVLHSRVAHSNIKLLTKFGCKITVVSLRTLMPLGYEAWLNERYGVNVTNNFDQALLGADVIMMLRIQQERMQGCYIPSLSEYNHLFGLTSERLKLAPNAIVMHPGPVNRGVEICSDVLDDASCSLVLDQVSAGVAVRAAVLSSATSHL